MKILLLAGEESGLIYARAIAARLDGHEVRGYADYGFRTADLAVVGVFAVLRRLGYFLRVARTMKRAIDEWRPDVVLTVDYPGMNLKLAAYAKARGIRAVHVVCPQVWAWKRGRIPKIEASLDALCCFFPFEPALFRPGFATFIGHPLVGDFAATAAAVKASPAGDDLVALLPGSRRGEIERNLPPLLAAARRLLERHPALRFAVPAVHKAAEAHIRRLVAAGPEEVRGRTEIRLGRARETLLSAKCAAVASGTATLEAALAGCPTALVYRVSALTAFIARRVIKGTKFLGLANILWDKGGGKGGQPPMPEYLQEDLTPEAVAERLAQWLDDDSARAEAVRRLAEATALLVAEGDPVSRILSAALPDML